MTVLPDVAVVIVRLPEVFVQPDAPPEAIVNTPVELPILVAAVPVALMLAVPVNVTPPVPRIRSAAVAVSSVVPERDQYPIVPDVGAVEVRFFDPSV